jgi:hypothetical protein
MNSALDSPRFYFHIASYFGAFKRQHACKTGRRQVGDIPQQPLRIRLPKATSLRHAAHHFTPGLFVDKTSLRRDNITAQQRL